MENKKEKPKFHFVGYNNLSVGYISISHGWFLDELQCKMIIIVSWSFLIGIASLRMNEQFSSN